MPLKRGRPKKVRRGRQKSTEEQNTLQRLNTMRSDIDLKQDTIPNTQQACDSVQIQHDDEFSSDDEIPLKMKFLSLKSNVWIDRKIVQSKQSSIPTSIDVMSSASADIPEIKKRGRPPKKNIQRCLLNDLTTHQPTTDQVTTMDTVIIPNKRGKANKRSNDTDPSTGQVSTASTRFTRSMNKKNSQLIDKRELKTSYINSMTDCSSAHAISVPSTPDVLVGLPHTGNKDMELNSGSSAAMCTGNTAENHGRSIVDHPVNVVPAQLAPADHKPIKPVQAANSNSFVENQVQSEPDVSCVAAGTKHQGHMPGGGNSQCVVMSSCGIALSVVRNRSIFNTADIDMILEYGNDIYVNEVLQGGEPRFIEPESIPSVLTICNYTINIDQPEWLFNGLFPTSLMNTNVTLDYFEKSLEELLVSQNYDITKTGFLFTGKNSTVSFWFHENDFYLFNSHAVDSTGSYNHNNYSLNVARMFKIRGINNLAIFLLNDITPNAVQYSIHRLTINAYSLRTESNIISNTREAIVATESQGRTKKIKSGPNKTHPNSHSLACQKYNEQNPQTHRIAVKRYTQQNPEIHRKAVSRYSQKQPDLSRSSSQVYRTHKGNQIKDANIVYNRSIRRVETALRGPGLICQRTGDDLKSIPIFALKKFLLADDIFTCCHCGAKLFEEEKGRKQWCCGTGRYNIRKLEILNENFYDNAHFKKHARPYNNLFAFSALGVSHHFQNPATGMAFVKIQGRVYHRVFDLSYTNTTNPIGLYIDDGEERKRLASDQNLNLDILSSISNFLHRVNPFISLFKRLNEETNENAHIVFERTCRTTHGNILGDMPRGSEVAAIINTERESYIPKSIAIWKIGNSKPHTVDIFHPLYESLQYPLLYPYGGTGWTFGIKDNNGRKLSQTKYYRCLILSISRFTKIGRLSEEWIVDMYCRVEEERLRYLARLQVGSTESILRAAPMYELGEVIASTNVESSLNLDTANAVGDIACQLAQDETVQAEGGIVPGRVYLPNTFTGSPRYMKMKYMDAMAIVNRMGRPTYFLTMTCNPKWPEIANVTARGSTPSPDICARVFNLKLTELLKDLRSGQWFGQCEYIMYVIEFQKRGLPHAHICFRVCGGGPVQNTEIDKVVRADIPLENEVEGRLRKAVLAHLVHGPCNMLTWLPCWDERKSKCTKYFPKMTTETTFVDNKGFVYLKRNDKNTATIFRGNRNIEIDDTWIVPYNAALLLKYDCHINLEIASTRKVVKYLFKYMTKGPDEARVAIVPDELRNNEIEQYATKRYIGSCDAIWRLFEFDLTAREPNVKQLSVHLDGQQTVFFRAGREAEAIERARSDLLIYFDRPHGEEFDNLTYPDFYERYLIHSSRPNMKNVTIHTVCNGRYFITKRQRGEMVARLYWVNPNRGELFYLRMLLHGFPCRGYNDLKSLGGPDCTTFQETARVLGIANDEEEYESCLLEASSFFTGKPLRKFFVLLITNGAPALILWDKLKHVLYEDFLERCDGNVEVAINHALLELDRLLRKHGSCLIEHGLPEVEDDTTELVRERLEYNSVQLQSYVEHWLPLLSPEQRSVFDHVNRLLTTNHNNCDSAIFVDGPSGTGKTLLLNVIVAYVRGPLKSVALCAASSGIAAQNYQGGCTAHSMFRFPFELIDDSGFWNLSNSTQRAELIRQSSLIIYDEAPMSHKYLIHLLDRSLRDLMNSTKAFGGKVIVFAGDFRQLPPVVSKSRTHSDIVQASLITSPAWKHMTKYSLTQAQRTKDDENYSEFLLNLGSGLCDLKIIGLGREADKLLDIANQNLQIVTNLDALLNFVFPIEAMNDVDACASRAILCTINANVRDMNSRVLDRVEGDYIHCYGVDYVEPDIANEFYLGPDTLHRVQASGVPDYDLIIKKGCVCIIIRNLSFVDKLVNGTKVIVVNVSRRLITVRKPLDTETFLIPRILFKFPIEPSSPVEMFRRQFPLQVCYAMTIHKSQGQTIEKVGVDLRSDVFSHGQLYVALGRVRRKKRHMSPFRQRTDCERCSICQKYSHTRIAW